MSDAKQKIIFAPCAANHFKLWLYPSRPMKRRFFPIGMGFSYVITIFLLGGLKTDHIFIGLLCILDIYNEKTRHFLRYFFPFILTGIVYDSMRYYYWVGIQGHIRVA